MASVNKVKIGSTTYDVSPSPAGTLDTTSTTKFTSNDVDQAAATSYTSVNKIAATETNSSIFSKLTSMVRNTRYLHNKVGTTDISSIGDSVTAAISALSTRAPATHSHTTTDLPVSNSQINSSSYIPTSALIYSMNQTLTSLNDAITTLQNNNIFNLSHSQYIGRMSLYRLRELASSTVNFVPTAISFHMSYSDLKNPDIIKFKSGLELKHISSGSNYGGEFSMYVLTPENIIPSGYISINWFNDHITIIKDDSIGTDIDTSIENVTIFG